MTEKDHMIFDVSEAEFENKVIQRSFQIPVVVDFWAPWCAPCRILEPSLESAVRSFKGKILLARVNTEQNQALAVTWDIRSIPAVKIIREGKVAGDFVGAAPEEQIRALLEKFVPSEADELVNEGNKLLEKGAIEAAEAACFQALDIDSHHPGAHLGLARIYLGRRDWEKARQFAAAVMEGDKEYDAARGILAQIEFREVCRDAGDRQACDERLSNNPGDLEARYQLALCMAAGGEYRQALDELLVVLEKSREFKDRAAHQAILKIFSILGEDCPYLDEYRSRLSMILFS